MTEKVARTPGRAVGYVRVSSADQAENGWSLGAQRERVAAYCAARGWELVDVYGDEGVSALKTRPQFDKMVKDVLADGVSHIVCLKLDRLGRRAVDLLRLYDQMERKGVALVAIEDSIDTSTPVGRLLRTVLAAIAEFERDTISERTKIGLEAARAAGVRLGAERSIPEAVRAHILQLAAEGHGARKIAGVLNAAGVPTAQGGACWYPSTVARVLKQEG